jgi:hypothetical protein
VVNKVKNLDIDEDDVVVFEKIKKQNILSPEDLSKLRKSKKENKKPRANKRNLDYS